MEKGWKDNSEVNRVIFNPDLISVDKMEDVLNKSGTYIGTIDE